MYNIGFRRQRHDLFINACNLNAKRERTRKNDGKFESTVSAQKSQTSRTWATSDRWKSLIVAGEIYGMYSCAHCEETFFLSILPSFVLKVPEYLGENLIATG